MANKSWQIRVGICEVRTRVGKFSRQFSFLLVNVCLTASEQLSNSSCSLLANQMSRSFHVMLCNLRLTARNGD